MFQRSLSRVRHYQRDDARSQCYGLRRRTARETRLHVGRQQCRNSLHDWRKGRTVPAEIRRLVVKVVRLRLRQ